MPAIAWRYVVRFALAAIAWTSAIGFAVAAPTLADLFADGIVHDVRLSVNERDLRAGSLGQFEAKYLMALALSNAGRMTKYGA